MRPRFAALLWSLAAALLAGAYIALSWSHDVATLGGDSAQYLLGARHYSPYQAASTAVEFYSQRIIYPPLFPLMLALVGGGESILIAHLFVAACALGSVAALFGFLKEEGLPVNYAGAGALLFGMLPGTLLMSLDVWTENLYLLLSVVALFAVARSERSVSSGDGWLAAAAVAMAGLTRVAAVPLLASYCAYLLVRRPKRWPVLMALAVAPFAAWVVLGSIGQTGISGYTHQLSDSYGGVVWVLIAQNALTEAKALLDAWLFFWLLEGRRPVLVWLILGFGVVCVVAAVMRLRKLRLDAIYLVLYLGMLMVWPHPEEAFRYGYVVFPVLMAQGWILILQALPAAARRYSWAAPVLLALAALPSLVLMVQRFNEPLSPDAAIGRRTWAWFQGDRAQARRSALEHARFLAHVAAMNRDIPAKECVFSIKPPLIMLYADRVSIPPPKSAVGDSEFQRAIGQCGFAHVVPFGSPNFAEPFYPMKRLGARAELVSAQPLDAGRDGTVVSALLRVSP
jgi:hypothetical protein